MRLIGVVFCALAAIQGPMECMGDDAEQAGQPAKNEYLYQVKPTRPAMLVSGLTPAEKEILSEHEVYLKGLQEDGTVLLYGRTQNRDESAFGIVLFAAASDTDAQRVMEADPGVKRGLMVAKLFPYKIAYLRGRTASSTPTPVRR